MEWLRSASKTAGGAAALQGSSAVAGVLEAQLRDLRSAVVRDACLTVMELSKSLGNQFDTSQPALARTLLELSGGGNSVIKELVVGCVRQLFTTTQAPAAVEVVLGILGTARHKDVLCSSFLALHTVVQKWNVELWTSSLSAIERVVERGANNASLRVRNSARHTYHALAVVCPEECAAMLVRVDARTRQRLVEVVSGEGGGGGTSGGGRRRRGGGESTATKKISGRSQNRTSSRSGTSSADKPWIKARQAKQRALRAKKKRDGDGGLVNFSSSPTSAAPLPPSTFSTSSLPTPVVVPGSPALVTSLPTAAVAVAVGAAVGDHAASDSSSSSSSSNSNGLSPGTAWIKLKRREQYSGGGGSEGGSEGGEEGGEEGVEEGGEEYFYYLNQNSNEISFTPWVQVRDVSGSLFYYNVETKSKVWRPPRSSTGITHPLRRALSEEGRRALHKAFLE